MYTYTYTVHNLCAVKYDSYTCSVGSACSVAFVVFVYLYICIFIFYISDLHQTVPVLTTLPASAWDMQH